MTIRVLHVFAPNFKQRFGGPIFDWKFAFSHWNEDRVRHLVLDLDEKSLVDAQQAFSFELSSNQQSPSRFNRAFWAIPLSYNLIRFANQYDLIHYHILWWGSLVSARIMNKKPSLYQSVLLGADTPGSILKERFGRAKLNLLKRFSSIVTISEALTDDYLFNGFSPERVHTIMNSVDTEIFKPIPSLQIKQEFRFKHQLPSDKKILIFVGSVIHRKGVDILIESFIEAQKKQEELFLVIVGPHKITDNPSIDENFVKMLEDKINQENIRSKVLFMGLVKNRQDLAEIYQASDIFVFPSRQEGLGNVVLEAMACGLPVIVSDLPVLKGVVTDMVDGLKVPMNDPLALENSVYTLMNNVKLCRSIKEKAREYVLNNHSFEDWQSALTQIYDTLSDHKHFLRNTINGKL